jgi:DNA-binding transcriptional regulator YhcF (GntR family)
MAEKRHDDAKEPVAEYLKIRQYVIGLVVNAGSESVKIPSMPVLGTQFGVARMTVHKALKDLIKDLYLIVKPGIGIFTNPRRLPEMATGSHHKCVGLVAGRGHYCFYDHYSWLLLSQAGVAASEKGRFVKIINLTSDSPARMAMELRTSWIDGLICWSPTT